MRYPADADIVIDTSVLDIGQSIEKIMEHLREKKLLLPK